LTKYISILEAVRDHGSARKLQEQLIENLDEDTPEVKKVAFSKLRELCQRSSDSIYTTLQRVVNRSEPQLDLESKLKGLNPNCLIPPVHQILITWNKTLILETTKQPGWKENRDFFGLRLTALQCATSFDYAEGISILLDAGSDINDQGGAEISSLHIAVAQGHFNACRILIKARADVNCPAASTQATPLHDAASRG